MCEIALQNEACLHRQQKQILTIGRLFRCNISSLPLPLASDIGRAVGWNFYISRLREQHLFIFYFCRVRPSSRARPEVRPKQTQ